MRTVLQIPMTASLKNQALSAAKDMGFSSLQEAVRVMLKKLASNALSLSFEEKIIPLSAKNEKRFLKMDRDFKSKKNTYTARDVTDLLKQLDED